MRIKLLIFSFLFFISNSVFAADEDNTALVMNVWVKFVGVTTSYVTGFWVTNMDTHKSYGNRNGGTLQMLELPEGVYCIEEVDFMGGEVEYCKPPFIKVLKGKLNNAGLWRFEVNLEFNEIKLAGSAGALEQTLGAAIKKYPKLLKE